MFVYPLPIIIKIIIIIILQICLHEALSAELLAIIPSLKGSYVAMALFGLVILPSRQFAWNNAEVLHLNVKMKSDSKENAASSNHIKHACRAQSFGQVD